MEYLNTYESFFKNPFKKKEKTTLTIETLRDFVDTDVDDITFNYVDVLFEADKKGMPVTRSYSDQENLCEIFPIGPGGGYPDEIPDYVTLDNPKFKKGVVIYDESDKIQREGNYEIEHGLNWMDETERWYRDEFKHLNEVAKKLNKERFKQYGIGYSLISPSDRFEDLRVPCVILFYQL